MQLKNSILILVCSLFFASCKGDVAELHDVNGNVVQPSFLHGKWIILNYWAAWCATCIKEIPELDRFYQHNQDKSVVLYGVNYDRLPKTELQTAMRKINIAFPVLLEDPQNIWKLDDIEALPVTFIIDPHGKVVKKILGANTEKSLLDILFYLQQ
ncbi:MAG: hypothetical protein ACD_45C00630G0009 [uncultured bacterium]|nr:MAG: hypothetical protein ACD_45C00630G0009 [uncultured bacterium]